ncbi:NAD(P)/FAD-dependent oxidoreductase [Porphyromonas catoniae]|uniref:NADH:ubiquinone reductase (non-electrogenic) n=1 Tax=Porphyromonas catoniae ATCC 51270 TaxID=887901 RepID=Z4X1S0_9PORP|nr:NAD(P)/FAD-dependent oxidoreductase [Porphyromonas catoniae]EWC93644.1 pyridine nucleotide-disulfide oxidoreductase [Porphyromonas catoniae ATCC 51270]
MSINIPQSSLPRVVIAGGGFGGLKLAQELDSRHFQVILIDHHNYHQFPPLIYQVASSGLEPSSIAFPFRSALRKKTGFVFRLAEVQGVAPERNLLLTSVGEVKYDYLILACGGTTNFFGNDQIARHSLPMKTLYESMNLRNVLLQNIEKALVSDDEERRNALLTVAIVGGGPSGVEIAGALAEMKRYVLPKDYPYLDSSLFRIHLLDASPRLLQAMSERSSETAARGLREMGVEIHTGTMVSDYDGKTLRLSDGSEMKTRTVIWVSGIVANAVEGIQAEALGRGRRILVDEHNEVKGLTNVFAIGDQCLMTADANYPNGHPQLAQVAIQQARLLARNLRARQEGKPLSPFHYKDLGSMATIGRNRAVAEIRGAKWGGFTAWMLWLVVHLRSILSVRNKVIVLLNWIWNYVTYDRSLRLILKRNIPVEPYHQREQRERREHEE